MHISSFDLLMIGMLVEDMGYEYVLATNGREALQQIEQSTTLPDLVITDVMMPYMNGVDLLRHLRRHDHLATLPVIMMSAAASPEHHELADAFIHKPFDLDTLADLIENYINRVA